MWKAHVRGRASTSRNLRKQASGVLSDAEVANALHRVVPRMRNGEELLVERTKRYAGILTRLRMLLEQHRAAGDNVGPLAFAACLKICCEAKNDTAAWEIYHAQVAVAVVPNHMSYIWLMWAAAHNGDAEGATAAWKLMRKAGHAKIKRGDSIKATHLFSALVTAHTNAGDEDGALRVARSFLTVEKVRLTRPCFNALLGARQGLKKRMLTLRWGIAHHSIDASDPSLYSCLLRACTQPVHIKAVMGLMQRNEVQVTRLLWYHVLMCYKRCGDAERVLEVAAFLHSKGELHALGYRAAIAACVEAFNRTGDGGYVATAEALYSRACLTGYDRVSSVHISLLKMYAATGDSRKADLLREQMMELGLRETPRVVELTKQAHERSSHPQSAVGIVLRERPAKNFDILAHTQLAARSAATA
ncbi:Pentatricopeptide repeat-containing protein [Diplonema papillatum]|nr:Pentatricopeptide repeat-containing protein [Diplonema papillatum]